LDWNASFKKNAFRHSDAIVNKSLERIFSTPSTGIIENLSAAIDAEQTRNFTAEELFNYHSRMTDAESLMPKLCPDLKYYFEGDAEAPLLQTFRR